MSRLRTLLRAAFDAPAFSVASSLLRKEVNESAVRRTQSRFVADLTGGVAVATKTTPTAATRFIHTAAHQQRYTIPTAASVILARQARLITRGLATIAAHASHTSQPSTISTAGAALTAGLTPGMRRALTVWLAGGSAWVFSMVVLGGVTRLTRSGLSMTDWKFTGERPPSSPEEWEVEFEKYKASPEFKKLNSTMTVEEFKFIYWMEWAHRMWGRALGVFFAVPCLIFAARGAINHSLGRRLALLFLMGGSQGLVGWWMVRSGLVEHDDNRAPRVSPYRLAAHLTSAFAIYATMVWTTLSVAFPHPPVVTSGPPGARAAAALYKLALPASILLGITAISGAFVAGLDAGHAYNTFPDMNGEWIPCEYWDIPGWRNAFENTAAVQLHHRVLALSTLLTSIALWRYGTRMPDLPRSSRLLLHALVVGVAGQVTLGITTLLTYVPVSLGSAHQAGAMTLFTIMLGLLYTIRPAPTLAPFRALTTAPWSTISAASAVLAVGGIVANTA